jgi:hypothetical protein
MVASSADASACPIGGRADPQETGLDSGAELTRRAMEWVLGDD